MESNESQSQDNHESAKNSYQSEYSINNPEEKEEGELDDEEEGEEEGGEGDGEQRKDDADSAVDPVEYSKNQPILTLSEIDEQVSAFNKTSTYTVISPSKPAQTRAYLRVAAFASLADNKNVAVNAKTVVVTESDGASNSNNSTVAALPTFDEEVNNGAENVSAQENGASSLQQEMIIFI